MTTEVQIGRNRVHLELLRKVISRSASWAGMTRKDTLETEEAVSQVCTAAMENCAEDVDTPLTVSISADPSSVTVDIRESFAGYLSLWSDYGDEAMAQTRQLVDAVECTTAGNCATIRLTKRARSAEPSQDMVPVYAVSSLQS